MVFNIMGILWYFVRKFSKFYSKNVFSDMFFASWTCFGIFPGVFFFFRREKKTRFFRVRVPPANFYDEVVGVNDEVVLRSRATKSCDETIPPPACGAMRAVSCVP